MIRTLKFIAAMFVGLGIAAQLGWIKILHPKLESIHQLLLKGVNLFLYLIQ